MKPKVYIDGQEGTTGLQIYQRLGDRSDLQLLLIDPKRRKDREERARLMNQAEIVFLCLPDDAAREAVTLVTNPETRIIDASTAHRTAKGWDYGFAELSTGHRAAIAGSKRVANPGCHATGFLSTVYPLVAAHVLPADYPLTCYSLTGYSGGGKKMIAEYEDPDRDPQLDSPNIYALGLQHKHLPEMMAVPGLEQPPAFSPILGDIYKGMATSVLLHNRYLKGKPTAEEIWQVLSDHYAGQKLVKVAPFGGTAPRLATNTYAGKDFLEVTVCGNQDQTMLTARFDNLGKGASGAAVQNMNLMLGLEETTGLVVE
jgi:N-acetyl-gamma-glutamyl-phosphate reductase